MLHDYREDEMNGLDQVMCKKLRQKDKIGINGKFNENKTRMNSFLLQFEEENVQKGWKNSSRCWFVILERERERATSL